MAIQAEGIYFPTNGKDCGCQNDLMNFAPRLGIAWKLNEKTVIRAGAGIYFAQPDGFDSQFSNFFTGPPKANELTFTANNTVPVAKYSQCPTRLVSRKWVNGVVSDLERRPGPSQVE